MDYISALCLGFASLAISIYGIAKERREISIVGQFIGLATVILIAWMVL